MVNTLDCSTNVLSVGWAAAGAMPANYSATATAGDGTELECITEGWTCTINGLQCGEGYEVTVTGVTDTCQGPRSAPELVRSGENGIQTHHICSFFQRNSSEKSVFSFSFSSLRPCQRPKCRGLFLQLPAGLLGRSCRFWVLHLHADWS